MPGLRDRKTPGVYITEIPAFPPSAVGVDTAIPAFVGYTERCEAGGRPAYGIPIPIASIEEYHTFFGGAPKSIFTFEEGTEQDYDLQFAGLEATGKAAATGPAFKKLKRTGPVGLLYQSLTLFYANGGSRCYIVSVGPYGEEIDWKKLVEGVQALEDQAGPTMLLVPDLSLLAAGADNQWAVPGFRDVAVAMLNQCQKKQDRVALFDVVHTRNITRTSPTLSQDLAGAIEEFRKDVDHEFRSYGIAYFPHLNTSLVRAADLDFTWFEGAGLQDFVLNEARKLFPKPEDETVAAAIAAVKRDFTEQKSESDALVKKALDDLKETNQAAAQKLGFLYYSFYDAAPDSTRDKIRDQNLVNAFPGVKHLYSAAARLLNRLPASAAMAGVMTFTDTARGVWNAPANIALTGVEAPALTINDDVQGDLNKPLDGKAINVIREFIGRGPVVWGARTLDGNSNDYRYIQVRRTLIYIEQSVKMAMSPFVFAPNDGKTWVNVTSMISNFLQDLWAKGGLMGTTANDAFSVDCGLGITMTARDVLEGYLIVRVLLQMIRPAEFIELTFKQKMESAG
jgi:Bacteriophage tail sheath protein